MLARMGETSLTKDNPNRDFPHDVRFDPYRSPCTDRLKTQVEEVTQQVEVYEEYFQMRKRKRKPVDEQIFKETVSAIVCDLMYNYLSNPEKKIFLTLSHRHLGTNSRYRSRVLGKKLPSIIEILSSPDLGFICMSKGGKAEQGPGEEKKPARATTIWPDEKLVRRIQSSGITLSDFGRRTEEEVILLKREKYTHLDKGRLIEYQNTDLTREYREQVCTINQWLSNVDITATGKELDVGNRHLHRIFNNGRFDQGGRLYGGFWQGMKKKARLLDIRIDNCRIVELDYGQMFLRLSYGMAGKDAPEGDLYSIPALNERGATRQGIKEVINAWMFTTKPPSRLPQGTREHFDKKLHFADIREGILEYHKDVAHLFFRDTGMQLMFLESNILVTNMLALIERRITSLPIHDALLVPSMHKDVARRVMLDTFELIGRTTAVVNTIDS